MESGNDPRIERLKEVLSASYPRVDDPADLESLPRSVAGRFQPALEEKLSLWGSLLSWLAHPMPAFAAAALVVFCAFLFNRSEPTKVAPGPGPDLRSKGDSAAVASLVLVDAPDEVMAQFKESGYFPDELLHGVESYTIGEGPVIVLDWKTRTISHNFSGQDLHTEEMPPDQDELLELVLTLYQESFSG